MRLCRYCSGRSVQPADCYPNSSPFPLYLRRSSAPKLELEFFRPTPAPRSPALVKAMDSAKRRILVAFADDDSTADDRSRKRQKKGSIGRTIVEVFIDKHATNAELAKEVADAFEQPNVTLEISNGSELRENEYVGPYAASLVSTNRQKVRSTRLETTKLLPQELLRLKSLPKPKSVRTSIRWTASRSALLRLSAPFYTQKTPPANRAKRQTQRSRSTAK